MVSAQKLPSSDLQNKSFVSARVGEDLTIPCFYDARVPTKIYWYKQIVGQRPKLIVTFRTERRIFSLDEIKDYPRFKMDCQSGKALLTITDLNTSDSALYHCMFFSYQNPTFSVSVTVSVKGFGSDATLIRQPGSEMIRPPGSVTLDCTVHTGSCDGEHHVYWYKESEESLPVLFHTHGGRNDQCDTQDNTCFYQLPMDNLTQADAGMYYCAVAACGQVLFGKGTQLDFPNKVDPWMLVYLLSGLLTFSIFFSVFLAFSLYKLTKKNSSQYSGAQEGFSSPSAAETEQGFQEPDNLHYAALSHKKNNRSRRQRTAPDSDCVYSSVSG
ncbi:unnamed protein product [Ophioblennius macclurei]